MLVLEGEELERRKAVGKRRKWDIYGYDVKTIKWKTWGTLKPGDNFIMPDGVHSGEIPKPCRVVENGENWISYCLPHNHQTRDCVEYRNKDRSIKVVKLISVCRRHIERTFKCSTCNGTGEIVIDVSRPSLPQLSESIREQTEKEFQAARQRWADWLEEKASA